VEAWQHLAIDLPRIRHRLSRRDAEEAERIGNHELHSCRAPWWQMWLPPDSKPATPWNWREISRAGCEVSEPDHCL